jgi:S-(hydroxymethyl)glutathione dehydrogenase / alcohol dehydrogenase
MKAAICYDYGKPLIIEDINIEAPRPGEVKVRVAATAICHSDIHMMNGDFGQDSDALPIVTGHETAGIVAAIGTGVTDFKPGDRVVVSLLWSCGVCYYCKNGQPNLCTAQFNKNSGLTTQHGQAVARGIRVGGFAEYVLVHETQLVPVPDDMPLESAALLACGVITGIGAVTNTAQVEPGRSVVVIGTGGVGLNAVQGAALSGANPIIAVDLLDSKLEAARTFGATHTVNAKNGNPVDNVKQLTDGYGAEYVFVTVGSEQAVQQAIEMIRKQGVVVLVGLPGGSSVQVPVSQMVINEGRIMGSFMGSTKLSLDVPRLIAQYQLGRLKFDELITARYPLEGINEAIAATNSGEALRNLIVFDVA